MKDSHPEVWLTATDSSDWGKPRDPAPGITSWQGREGKGRAGLGWADSGVGLGYLKGPCSWFSFFLWAALTAAEGTAALFTLRASRPHWKETGT